MRGPRVAAALFATCLARSAFAQSPPDAPPAPAPPASSPPAATPPPELPPPTTAPPAYGYPPYGYPPYGYPPSGYPPNAYPPNGYPPNGVPPNGYPPSYGYPPNGYPPPAPPPPPREKREERRTVVLGAAIFGLANVHWIDQPSDRNVSAGGVNGTEAAYPGFVGTDLTYGLALDARFFEWVGVELDLMKQDDHGKGTIKIVHGSLIPCVIINNGPSPSSAKQTDEYDVTIGQLAWHVPILAKLALPTSKAVREDDDVDRELVVGWLTLAIGPELVFPGTAELVVSPTGLPYPQRATVSTYVTYTAAVGFERRLTKKFDLRILGSLRGSYDPSIGSSASGRAEYENVGGTVESIAYRSEWRYQLAATLGIGVYF